MLWALDKKGRWGKAKVIRCDRDEGGGSSGSGAEGGEGVPRVVRVNYCGFSKKWDEDIQVGAGRLRSLEVGPIDVAAYERITREDELYVVDKVLEMRTRGPAVPDELGGYETDSGRNPPLLMPQLHASAEPKLTEARVPRAPRAPIGSGEGCRSTSALRRAAAPLQVSTRRWRSWSNGVRPDERGSGGRSLAAGLSSALPARRRRRRRRRRGVGRG